MSDINALMKFFTPFESWWADKFAFKRTGNQFSQNWLNFARFLLLFFALNVNSIFFSKNEHLANKTKSVLRSLLVIAQVSNCTPFPTPLSHCTILGNIFPIFSGWNCWFATYSKDNIYHYFWMNNLSFIHSLHVTIVSHQQRLFFCIAQNKWKKNLSSIPCIHQSNFSFVAFDTIDTQ